MRRLMHPLRHNQVIVRYRQLRRVAQTEASPPPQVTTLRVRARTPSLPRFSQLLQLSRDLLQPLLPPLEFLARSAPWFLGLLVALLLPAPDALPEPRPSRRNPFTLSLRSGLALASTRVASIATRPNFPIPIRRAASNTCVNTTFSARGCRRRNWFSVQ